MMDRDADVKLCDTADVLYAHFDTEMRQIPVIRYRRALD